MSIPSTLPPWLVRVLTICGIGCLLYGAWLAVPTQASTTWPEIFITMVAPDGRLVQPFGQGIALYDPTAPLPTLRQTLLPSESIDAIAFSADGRLLLVSTRAGQVQLWSVPEQQLLQTWDPPVTDPTTGIGGLALAPRGDLAAWTTFYSVDGPVVGLEDHARYTLVSLPSNTLLEQTDERVVGIRERKTPADVLVSPDGQYLIARGATVWVRQLTDRHLVYVIAPPPTIPSTDVNQIAISPDQRWLALAYPGTVMLHRFADGTLVHTITVPQTWPYSTPAGRTAVAFSPDSRLLAVGTVHGSSGWLSGLTQHWEHVHLWDTTTGALVQTMAGHLDGTYALNFSADGRRLITVGDGGTRFWPVAPRPVWAPALALGSGLVLLALRLGWWIQRRR